MTMNMYIKMENGEPVNHPILESNLLDAYQLTEVTEEFMKEHSLARFEKPAVAPDVVVLSQDSYETGEDGVVRAVYESRLLTQEEKVDLWVRRPRNIALAQSDWSQMPDAPLSKEKKAEWAEYRQTLRDMTAVYAAIQDPSEIVPPEPPAK